MVDKEIYETVIDDVEVMNMVHNLNHLLNNHIMNSIRVTEKNKLIV